MGMARQPSDERRRDSSMLRRVAGCAVGLLSVVPLTGACGAASSTVPSSSDSLNQNDGRGATRAATAWPTLVAVGDIACDPSQPQFNAGKGTPGHCQHRAVAAAVNKARPSAFLPLGDVQYTAGRLAAFRASYGPAFGRLLPVTHPVPGNHEYKSPGAAGYFAYFGAAAHPASPRGYSFDVGTWHVLAINSELCTAARPCGPGSALSRWVAADIAAHPKRCLAVAWHRPVLSVGQHGTYAPLVPLANQLWSYGADILLTGHDHLYSRTVPLGRLRLGASDGSATATPDRSGMVHFVVGTGGQDNYAPIGLAKPGVKARYASVGSGTGAKSIFGALRLTLRSTGYDFAFLPAAGTRFADSGSRSCRAKVRPVA